MSDEELTHFATNEGANLTVDAFQLLRSEFLLRRLPTGIIDRIEDGSHVAEIALLKKVFKTVPDQSSITALALAINEKRDGETNEVIQYHLLEEGLEEEHARRIIEELKPESERLLKKANAGMLTSVFIVLAGVALELISPEKSFVTFLDIASTCTIIMGILKLFKSIFDHNKYKTVILNLEKEAW